MRRAGHSNHADFISDAGRASTNGWRHGHACLWKNHMRRCTSRRDHELNEGLEGDVQWYAWIARAGFENDALRFMRGLGEDEEVPGMPEGCAL